MKALSTALLARLIGIAPFKRRALTFSARELRVEKPDISIIHSFSDIDEVRLESSLLWVRIVAKSGSRIVFQCAGFGKSEAKSFHRRLLSAHQKYKDAYHAIERLSSALSQCIQAITELTDGSRYAANCMIEEVLERIANFDDLFALPADLLEPGAKTTLVIEGIKQFKTHHKELCDKANEHFIKNEQALLKPFFDTVEGNPLTDMQSRAVITHEDSTLVIAGAGSGKTSVIVAKAGYLMEKNLADSDHILLVAFNRKAAKEIEERIKTRLERDLKATTFHAIGLEILSKVEGLKPSLNVMAEDPIQLDRFIQNTICEVIEDPQHYETLIQYFQSHFAPYKSQFDFGSMGEYWDYVKANELRTLQGERCKSYEECEIANFLFLNGIAYEYERPYEIKTASQARRQYKPDFYLRDYGIYIEHFGIDEHGNPPSHYDNPQAYTDGIVWKRQIHKENKTVLIQTYSYLKRQNRLLSTLKQALMKQNVCFNPISPDAALNALKQQDLIGSLSNVLGTFLNHYKGNGYSEDRLLENATQKRIVDDRFKAFLTIFFPILARYNKILAEREEVDFHDMIIKAAKYVEEERFNSPFKCLLVDEFQDISAGRARLILALKNQSRTNRLFGVGDDWQAIYRFAGSDIALMKDFEKTFGFSKSVTLDQTFRFNDMIADVSGQFIMRNPGQLTKEIRTRTKARKPSVILHYPKSKDDPVITNAMESIQADIKTRGLEEAEVMLLARYNFIFEGMSVDQYKAKFPTLTFSQSTIHKAKGLESDYVIVLGLRRAVYGFPSEVSDDPLLEAVLAAQDIYPKAEERRLFYVALTRAKHAVHIIVDRIAPSSFAIELASTGYKVQQLGGLSDVVHCPICKTGILLQRTSMYGVFYSCNHSPYCDYKTHPCPQCGAGLMRLDRAKKADICTNRLCRHVERHCPKCGDGRMIERHGQYGSFLGCTNFKDGCRHTQKLSH